MIKFNEKNIKKLKKNGKLIRNSILCGLLTTTLLTGCNEDVFDFEYGFDKALILGNDTATILEVEKWKDYQGEQLQFVTDDGLVLLTSSFDTNCVFGQSKDKNIEEVAKNSISENGKVYHLNKDDNDDTTFNKTIIDSKYNFNKVATFNNDKALILPVVEWKDYEGEQIQVISEDGLALNLCSYNSKLIFDKTSKLKAKDIADCYVGENGKVTDLSTKYDSVNDSFNYDLIDTKYCFNKAIILKDKTATIVPLNKWKDYDGEQLQLDITNGPTIVTASYDTILVNDNTSTCKALDIASSLADNVNDLTKNVQLDDSFYNGTFIDLEYGFSNAIISKNNSASSLKIDEWSDYEGEQLQIKLPNGDTILSSSMSLDLVNGGTNILNSSSLTKSYTTGDIIDESNGDKTEEGFNKDIIDTELHFNYALKVVNGNVTIIPINEWTDYYNCGVFSGKDEDKAEENCEQLQLVLPDDTVVVTSAYDTALVKTNDVTKLAEYFKGENGVINDLTPYVGKPDNSFYNHQIFDTKYTFTHAIMTNDYTSQVFKIQSWTDYDDGEQLQIKFNDNTGMLTSYVNTSLVLPKTNGIEEILAQSFTGDLNKNNTKKYVKVYK